MYSFITKMTAISQVPQEQVRLLEFTLAAMIAQNLPLPKERVEAPGNWFSVEYRLRVNEVLSAVNEYVVFDLENVRTELTNHWLTRYHTAYGTSLARHIDTVVYGTQYSDEQRQWVKHHRAKINATEALLREEFGHRLRFDDENSGRVAEEPVELG